MRSVCSLLITLVLAAAPGFAAPPDEIPSRLSVPRDGGNRIRTTEKRLGTLLSQGIARSSTLRTLVETLERGNVIVYLELQPALRRRLSGVMTFVTTTTRFRYVRISINPELPTETLIASIGHELQHALEVAQAETVVDDNTLSALYQRIGRAVGGRHVDRWDTDAAQEVGEQVRRELVVS
jgi:hypothetical protein